jgi:hypothetical protein
MAKRAAKNNPTAAQSARKRRRSPPINVCHSQLTRIAAISQKPANQ